MHTHMDTLLIRLSSCLNGDEHFLLPGSLLHLFPLSTLSCSLAKRRRTMEKTKGKRQWWTATPWHFENWDKERQTESWWAAVGLFSAEIQREAQERKYTTAGLQHKNNTVFKDLTTLLKCSKTIHANVHFHQRCWSKYTSWKLSARLKNELLFSKPLLFCFG